MAATHRNLPSDAPRDRIEELHEDVPDIPDAWAETDTFELPFTPKGGWTHEETGQIVQIEPRRRPTQMRNPRTSTDDTGYQAMVYPDADGKHGRPLTHELASKDVAYVTAIRFMAKYDGGDFEITPGDFDYDRGPVRW